MPARMGPLMALCERQRLRAVEWCLGGVPRSRSGRAGVLSAQGLCARAAMLGGVRRGCFVPASDGTDSRRNVMAPPPAVLCTPTGAGELGAASRPSFGPFALPLLTTRGATPILPAPSARRRLLASARYSVCSPAGMHEF